MVAEAEAVQAEAEAVQAEAEAVQAETEAVQAETDDRVDAPVAALCGGARSAPSA